MADLQNLIYDRTSDDVNNKTSKGYYNVSDLNRVEDWCKYLTEELKIYNYNIIHSYRDNPDNILKNGSLRDVHTNWNSSSANILTHFDDYITVKVNTDGTGTYPVYQGFDKISGNAAESKQIIYACAKVRGKASNSSWPRVYLSFYKNDSTDVSYQNLSSIDGKTNAQLNDGEWHTMSGRYITYNESTQDYFDYNRIAFGVDVATIGDEIDVKEVLLINLTKMFDIGNEPTKSWCDSNVTEYAKWQMWQMRTESEMERIRNNIRKIMSGFTFLTRIYSNAENFDYLKANNWEKILFELNQLYEGMKAEFLYSNTFFSGESEGLLV